MHDSQLRSPSPTARAEANRANAQHSTGPRTEAGKQRSAANATRHGLSGNRTLVVAGHEREEHEEFLAGWRTELQPHGTLETELFAQLVQAAWNLRRLSRAEAALLETDPLLSDDPAVQKKLVLYSIYQSRAERAFHKALAVLRQAQAERSRQEAAVLRPEGLPALLREALRSDAPEALDKRTQSPPAAPVPRAGQTNPNAKLEDSPSLEKSCS